MTCRVKERRSRKVDKRRRAKLRMNQDRTTVRQLQEKVLRSTGLWQMFQSIGNPLPALKGIWCPEIEVERGNDSTSDPALTQIVADVRHLLTKGIFTHPAMPAEITNQEFHTVAAPLLEGFANCRGSIFNPETANAAKKVRQFVTELRPEEIQAQFDGSMSQHIRDILLKYSRMNRNLYYLTIEGHEGLRFVIHKAAPRFRKFKIDGGRLAFQCSHIATLTAVSWVTWDCEDLGLCGASGRIPVFVQQHVLDRIVGPYSRLSAIVGTESSLHELLSRSLSEPKLFATDDPQVYLVEYGRDGVKLGYLLAQILSDAVLVRTFLFLTMGGTPEGNKLRSRLRQQRNGKTHLRLDSLESALKEAREDHAVRSIFKECGCGEVVEQVLMAEECKSAFAQ